MAETIGPGGKSASAGALLLGRRTYDDFAAYWPAQKDNAFTPVLDAATKCVVSTTLREPLSWEDSVLLPDLDAVAALKQSPGDGDLLVMGSGALVRALLERALVDRMVLAIHPLLLGSGTRMFAEGGPRLGLRLADSVTTTRGVVIAVYELG